MRRYHEPNLIHIAELGHIIGYNQVTYMNGIKGAKV